MMVVDWWWLVAGGDAGVMIVNSEIKDGVK